MILENLIGRKFGYLTVIQRSYTKSTKVYWDCECHCGTLTTVMGQHLRNGKTVSCGCARTGRVTHGHTRNHSTTPTYSTWQAMIKRCTNPASPDYPEYGGRGITVDSKWRSFENFLEDMGIKPTGLTIERVDNSKGYYKENCKWATQIEQANNRRPRRTL